MVSPASIDDLISAEQLTETLCELVDTPSPTGEEAELARKICARLERHEVASEIQHLNGGQANALGRIEGDGDRSLLLYAPLDTVTSNSAEEDLPWAGPELRNDMRAAGAPCWAMTNFAADSWERAVQLYPELGAFDGLVVSGREHTVKPEARIYEIIEQRTGAAPENLFFIDDRTYNIQMALDRGWSGHVFDGDVDALITALKGAGFPV